MPQKKSLNFQKELHNYLLILFSVFVLLLSFFNLTKQNKKTVQVLGANTDNTFWEEFVIKHPTYRDAWIELRRIDKIKEIDPNYFQP